MPTYTAADYRGPMPVRDCPLCDGDGSDNPEWGPSYQCGACAGTGSMSVIAEMEWVRQLVRELCEAQDGPDVAAAINRLRLFAD
jgi:DnaJ-class molecular chaperone